ncbi:hypothetical protein [Desulfogranum marinum]|uniref:hypothetical protein n=1 Tax=Desulfogranum marinum TaxID=453220 RepID=UPI0019664F78|nr:hypothetical protein [Desulfogranum marinum]MBM9515019.1 hypothetical protein [Desulfogranum marinum]
MQIVEARCTHCELTAVLPSIPDFVIDDNGKYIPLKYPGERQILEDVLGEGYDPKSLAERLVTYIPVACAACKTQFGLDIKKEAPQCSTCDSEDIYIITQYIEKTCPLCKEGVIKSTVL